MYLIKTKKESDSHTVKIPVTKKRDAIVGAKRILKRNPKIFMIEVLDSKKDVIIGKHYE